MSDKRQRARVQGSWARQPNPSKPTVTSTNKQPRINPVSASWGSGPQKTASTFEFHQPTKPIRNVPAEKVIEQAGDYDISHGPSGVSRLRLLPWFLSQEEADWMFSKLLAELPWSQKTNYRQAEAYEEPRLTCWYGELPYTYSHSTMAPNSQWHPLLQTLRETVEQATGCKFNSLLCNLYRDGHDSIGWHSDDEASLGDKPTIASLSLGDSRVFSLRKQPAPEENGDYTYVEKIRVPLSHGTLLLMKGATQDDWQHQVAKEYHDRGPRINLTFRTIYPEPDGHRPGTKIHITAQQQ
ncbi:alpha-ketoglutarate-dependent dioxygenase alkB homolog 3 [Cynoglossus semilaevis]|uniref:Alpha-ketoglutarate-dependent dioxygenase alkB homolog 3 n=1 Tax=Cynoglossus semilaevis TaxID=244447 RepID=A0A3P8UFI9_CYNSE|nr:alpha-ketoglutarate-dependent dioxygenase alkB homolog 3 [Cynoglossus semilaevis]XP_024912052.1 alpha-ketoglutarate-dependent dioxygenase alkB homolog 3 [Cynoglossus semilaevis]